MTRIALRFFNFPGLLLLVLVGIGLQTSLFSFWPLTYFQPDLVMLVVIWAALRRGLWEGGWITLLSSDFAELHSAVPQGLFMLTYMALFLAVRGLSRLMVIPNLNSLIMVTLFASVAWKLSNLGVLHLLGASGSQWKHTLMFMFPGAIVEGLVGIWVYRGLEKYDWITFKSVRKEQQNSAELDDELRLYQGEGI